MNKLSKANIVEPKIQFLHSIKDLKDLVTKIEQFNKKYDINL
ncbi:hypothetical protein [Nitrosopumilus sp. SJ]|nr:hypothetical protein [Nitrosopumilus sp. SJ]